MKITVLPSIFVLIALLVLPFYTQRWGRKAPTLDQILIESKAELIFVGEVDGYGRSYNPDGKGDSTTANYRVTKVLRGDASLSNVTITMPGHVGFGNGQVIMFSTSDRLRVDKNGVACSDKRCCFALFDWSLPYSEANEARVVKAISSKAKRNKK